jgi:hypothetical protein
MRLCLGGDYQAVHGCTRADAEAVNLPRVALPDDLQLVAPVNIKPQACLPQLLAQANASFSGGAEQREVPAAAS